MNGWGRACLRRIQGHHGALADLITPACAFFFATLSKLAILALASSITIAAFRVAWLLDGIPALLTLRSPCLAVKSARVPPCSQWPAMQQLRWVQRSPLATGACTERLLPPVLAVGQPRQHCAQSATPSCCCWAVSCRLPLLMWLHVPHVTAIGTTAVCCMLHLCFCSSTCTHVHVSATGSSVYAVHLDSSAVPSCCSPVLFKQNSSSAAHVIHSTPSHST
jgi:hypothetical protein